MLDLMIHNRLEQMFVEWNQKKGSRDGLHASSILAPESGSNQFCYREQVLGVNYRKVEPVLSPRLLGIFLHGWYVHKKWQDLFVECGVAIQVETTRKSPLWDLYHTPDAIIEILHRKWIVEIKSMNTNAFRNLKGPPQNAIRQAQLYMHLTGIPDSIILVEDKNTEEFKVWAVDYDPIVVQPFIERLYYIQQLLKVHASDGRLPRRLDACKDISSPRARNCPLREACFAPKADRRGMRK